MGGASRACKDRLRQTSLSMEGTAGAREGQGLPKGYLARWLQNRGQYKVAMWSGQVTALLWASVLPLVKGDLLGFLVGYEGQGGNHRVRTHCGAS